MRRKERGRKKINSEEWVEVEGAAIEEKKWMKSRDDHGPSIKPSRRGI